MICAATSQGADTVAGSKDQVVELYGEWLARTGQLTEDGGLFSDAGTERSDRARICFPRATSSKSPTADPGRVRKGAEKLRL